MLGTGLLDQARYYLYNFTNADINRDYMSFQYPDRITIEESINKDISPEWVELEVIVEGESSVYGNEALRKSKELVSFIKHLAALGYSSENISLENMVIQTSTGKLLKSSSARFTLRLVKIDLEKLPGILGVVSNQKNIELSELDYDFGDLSEVKADVFKELCINAKKQGLDVAVALGVSLLGVYSMSPKWSLPVKDDIRQDYLASGSILKKTRGGPSQELEGLAFSTNYKGKLSLNLKVDFRVGEFDA